MPDTSQFTLISEQIKQQLGDRPKPAARPFRKAVFRGLGVLFPPLLTIVIFLWIGGTVLTYVINPIYFGTRSALIWGTADIVLEKELPEALRSQDQPLFKKGIYKRTGDATYVPQYVWDKVLKNSSAKYPVPKTGLEVYQRYIELTYLQPMLFLPLTVVLFTLILYLLGKFIAAEVGRFFWGRCERAVEQVPLVSNIYGAVKQVSDFIFAEREIRYSRVVALEWPRKGVWALALVTSEGLPQIEKFLGEPVYAVLIPTSPMPLTGFTLTVRRSDTHDLDITIDQALQYIVSCGVVAGITGPAAIAEESGEKTTR